MELAPASLEIEPERQRVLEALRRHGWNSTSFQVLEPGFRYWFERGGCVAFVDTGSAWVAAGAPIADSDALHECAERFVEAAKGAGRRACFFAVERRFLTRTHFDSLLIGEQPVWDPRTWTDSVRASKSLREQLRRARAKGVTVRRVSGALGKDNTGTRWAVEKLIERWSRTRPLAPMGFLVAVHPFELPEERRYFVAEHEGRLVAFLAMVPVYARHGWLLEDFLRDPAAPNGTMELVIDHALQSVAEEQAEYATLGLAPLTGDVEGWLRAARDASSALYDFHGLRAFKEKLRPERWDEVFLAFPARQNAAVTVLDVLAAFSRVGLLRFGIETFLRVPSVLIQLLAALLVPWALMLALLHPTHWFPSRAVQFAWVAFDLVLAVGLFRLARRWGPRLANALAIVITLDALLTLFEVVRYNLPRITTHVDAFGAIIAVLAPSCASALLWRAWWLRHA
jgi:phosphatidylglycerol lysyltransferase